MEYPQLALYIQLFQVANWIIRNARNGTLSAYQTLVHYAANGWIEPRADLMSMSLLG
jgi:hypothetical protein